MTGDARDRAIGALLGLAIGDAVGMPLEFQQRDRLPPVTDMVGGGPFGLAPGQWTDDTSMALCLADSLLAVGAFDPADAMRGFVRWWQDGYNSVTGTCFDIGNTTRAALARFVKTGDPFAGDPDAAAAGNGSLMRLAPVVLFAWPGIEDARLLARRQSSITHAAAAAVDACDYFALLLSSAIAGEAKAAVLEPQRWQGNAAVARIAAGDWRAKSRSEIRSSGYVIDTLEAALWCCGHHDDFESAVLAAANLADDADTVAAVTGQLAGALYGQSGIPIRWLEQLAWRQHIETLAAALFDHGAG